MIKLTEKEVQILIDLDNSKITSSKKHLLEKVWKYNPDIKTSTVETHIHRLRKKLLRYSKCRKSKLVIIDKKKSNLNIY